MANLKMYYDFLKRRGFKFAYEKVLRKSKRYFNTPRKYRCLPEAIIIEISNLCNLRCEYCALHENMLDKAIMSEDTFLLLRPYFKYFTDISLSGLAEPLLNKCIVKYIEIIKSESATCRVRILSNAMLLTEDLASRLIESGLDSFSFSIDAEAPEMTNQIRTGSDHDLILENIKLLQHLKLKLNRQDFEITAFTVLQKKNYHQLPNILDLLSEIGVNQLSVNGLEPYFEQLVENILWGHNPPEDLFDVLEKSLAVAEKHRINLRLAGFVPQEPICNGISSPIILANGDVSPCPVLSYERDYFFMVNKSCRVESSHGRSNKISFGNIQNADFPSIWFGEEYVDFRRRIEHKEFPEECSHCLIKHQLVCIPRGLTSWDVINRGKDQFENSKPLKNIE